MKIQTDSGTDCYLAPLNRTTATDPTTISAPSNPNSMVGIKTQRNAYANNRSMEVCRRDCLFLNQETVICTLQVPYRPTVKRGLGSTNVGVGEVVGRLRRQNFAIYFRGSTSKTTI